MPGLALLLAIALPMAVFAGTAAGGESLSAACALIAAAGVGVAAWRDGTPPPSRLYLGIALLLAAAVAAVQATAIPAGAAQLLSPAASEVWSTPPLRGGWHPLSLAPHASSNRAALFLAAALLHVAGAWWIGAGRHQRLATAALALLAAGIAALAAAERLGGPPLWKGSFRLPDQAFGPFPNRNDVGVLAAAALPLAVALLAERVTRLRRRAAHSPEGWGGALRSGPDLAVAAAWCGVLALLAGTVLVSRSHSGAFAAVVGVSAFAVLAAVRSRRGSGGRTGLLAALGATAIALGGSLLAGNVPGGAAAIEGDLEVRGALWSRVTSVARSHPFTGAGAGALEAALPLHPGGPAMERPARAENDLLELLAELGLPAFSALLGLGLAWLALGARTALASGDEGRGAAAGVASVAALGAGAMGTFVVSVPALLLWGATAAALAVPSLPGDPDAARAALHPKRRTLLAAALVAGLLALPVATLRGAAAWIGSTPGADRTALARAARLDPRNPELSARLARAWHEVALRSPAPSRDAREEMDEAARWYLRRLGARPTDPWARIGFASVLETDARESSRSMQLRAAADEIRKAALRMAPGDPAVAKYGIERE